MNNILSIKYLKWWKNKQHSKIKIKPRTKKFVEYNFGYENIFFFFISQIFWFRQMKKKIVSTSVM